MSKLVRVSDIVYSKLDKIAQSTGFSKQDVIDQAIKSLERETILKHANEAYAEMRRNKQGWQEELDELDLWESTLEDGL